MSRLDLLKELSFELTIKAFDANVAGDPSVYMNLCHLMSAVVHKTEVVFDANDKIDCVFLRILNETFPATKDNVIHPVWNYVKITNGKKDITETWQPC